MNERFEEQTQQFSHQLKFSNTSTSVLLSSFIFVVIIILIHIFCFIFNIRNKISWVCFYSNLQKNCKICLTYIILSFHLAHHDPQLVTIKTISIRAKILLFIALTNIFNSLISISLYAMNFFLFGSVQLCSDTKSLTYLLIPFVRTFNHLLGNKLHKYKQDKLINR